MSSFEPLQGRSEPREWERVQPEVIVPQGDSLPPPSYLPDFTSLADVSGPGEAGSSESITAALDAARAEGEQVGFERGQAEEAAKVEHLIRALRDVIDALHESDQQREQQAAERSTAIATAVAGKLIQREVRVSPDIVLELVREAVAGFPVVEPLAVRMNPADLTRLSAWALKSEGADLVESGRSVRWIPDPDIRSGGCLVEGVERVMDGRLLHVLERVLGAFSDG